MVTFPITVKSKSGYKATDAGLEPDADYVITATAVTRGRLWVNVKNLGWYLASRFVIPQEVTN